MQSSINFRVIFLLTTIWLVCNSPVSAQRNPSRPTRGVEVDVRLTTEDTRSTPEQIRVQLMTSSGSIVADRFTGATGNITFSGIPAGNYRLKATGIDIEDAESTFYVDANDQHHSETLQVKRKDKGIATGSTQGAISAAELNIPEKAHKEFDKGIALLEQKDLAEAEKHFTKATEIYPQYAAAYNNRGVVAMRTGHNEEGKRLFEEALRADANNPGANVNLARCLIMEKKIPEAEKYLDKAISMAPLDAEPLSVLANAQMQAGQLDLALSNARKVHTLEHQRYSVSHLIAARILENAHRFDEAAAEYRLFLKENPDSPRAENVRAALQSLENRVK